MNPMKYKNYLGSVEFDEDDRLFYGRLLFVRALVSYKARDAEGLVSAFHEAVDDYVEQCAADGVKPEKPFKGSFNVRPGPDLHRRASVAALRAGMSLNAFVTRALEDAIAKQGH
jgi:predicted HicB family RNase H-like nuclease